MMTARRSGVLLEYEPAMLMESSKTLTQCVPTYLPILIICAINAVRPKQSL